MATGHLDKFEAKMLSKSLPDIVVATFRDYYIRLLEGDTGQIPEADIVPIDELPDAETFGDDLRLVGERTLPRTVVIKLNGGLGTSMGLKRAKSFLEVKDGFTFFDIIARQSLNANAPLVLMNSFATHADSLAGLASYPELEERGLAFSFIQHKYPKIDRADLSPVSWPLDRELEWNPPGHGDIYTALITSGVLPRLLERDYRYAFVSNSDNLGAVLDTSILGYLVENKVPFLMETADRTKTDRKGGHLTRRPHGQLILRDLAQCSPDDAISFQDVERHKYFNTNTVWIDLSSLAGLMAEKDDVLDLPLIRNAKTVDPRDPGSTPVYQLETAMGSAVSVFKDASAVRVPRSRFVPVKTTNDLIAVRSDAYVLTPDFRVVPNPTRSEPVPLVELDPRYFKVIDDLDARFPLGPPSLVECSSLRVQGDVSFGEAVVAKGNVELVNEGPEQVVIEDGAVLEGRHDWD